MELEQLLAAIEAANTLRVEAEAEWVGRHVRLLEPLGSLPDPDGGHVLLEAGAVGQIVQLTTYTHAPFVVRFPGFPYKVAPLLSKLELLP